MKGRINGREQVVVRYTRVPPIVVPRRLLQGRSNAVYGLYCSKIANAIHLRSDANDWPYCLMADNVSICLAMWTQAEAKVRVKHHTMTGVLVHVPLLKLAVVHFL